MIDIPKLIAAFLLVALVLTSDAQVVLPHRKAMVNATALGPCATVIDSSPVLGTSLISYWRLNESSGDAADAEPTGTPQTLTDINGVGSGAGNSCDARTFTKFSGQYLRRADSADLSAGDTDFTIAIWVYMTWNGYNMVLSKYDGGLQSEYHIDGDVGGASTGTDAFQWWVTGTSGGEAPVYATNFGSIVINTWYLVIVWHDSVANQIGISVNDVANTASHSLGVKDSTSPFELGGSSALALDYGGRLEDAAFWRRVLSSAERTALYTGTPP